MALTAEVAQKWRVKIIGAAFPASWSKKTIFGAIDSPETKNPPTKKARHQMVTGLLQYPRQDLNLCLWLRRPTLYPLSYGGRSAGFERES